jgi:hypothetical protein
MKKLVWIPFAGAAVVTFGLLLPAQSQGAYFLSAPFCAGSAAAIASFLACASFSRRDTLFYCWLANGIGYALATIRYSLYLFLDSGAPNQSAMTAMVLVQNVFQTLSLWLFWRAWKSTGLVAPGSRKAQLAWITAGIVVALLVGTVPLAQGYALFTEKTSPTAAVLLISTLSDIVSIALIVPLAIPALALRGGLLMQTWAYLAAHVFCWMAYDIWSAAGLRFGMHQPLQKQTEEIFRTLALLFVVIAAVAQRRAVSPPPPT